MNIKLLFCLLTISLSSFAQKGKSELPIDKSTKKITFSGEVKLLNNIDQDELLTRTKNWYLKSLKSPKNNEKTPGKNKYELVGYTVMQLGKDLSDQSEGTIEFTIKVTVKKNSFSYQVTNFKHTGYGLYPSFGDCEEMIKTKKKSENISYQKIFDKYLEQIDGYVNKMLAKLNEDLSKQS